MTASLMSLPKDILSHIASDLDPVDLKQMAHCSCSMAMICREEAIWKVVSNRLFPAITKPVGITWKAHFISKVPPILSLADKVKECFFESIKNLNGNVQMGQNKLSQLDSYLGNTLYASGLALFLWGGSEAMRHVWLEEDLPFIIIFSMYAVLLHLPALVFTKNNISQKLFLYTLFGVLEIVRFIIKEAKILNIQ